MRLKTVIAFDRRERDLLSLAFGPYRQLPRAQHEPLQKLSNIIEGGTLTEDHIKDVLHAMGKLEGFLQAETNVHPDPKWVTGTEAMKAQGKVPLVSDPETLMKTLREVRAFQVANLVPAFKILRKALKTLETVDQTFNTDLPDEEADDLVSPA